MQVHDIICAYAPHCCVEWFHADERSIAFSSGKAVCVHSPRNMARANCGALVLHSCMQVLAGHFGLLWTNQAVQLCLLVLGFPSSTDTSWICWSLWNGMKLSVSLSVIGDEKTQPALKCKPRAASHRGSLGAVRRRGPQRRRLGWGEQPRCRCYCRRLRRRAPGAARRQARRRSPRGLSSPLPGPSREVLRQVRGRALVQMRRMRRLAKGLGPVLLQHGHARSDETELP